MSRFKKLKKAIKSLALVFLATLAIFVLVNQFDEVLDPELQAILDKKQTPPADKDNAFYAYAGFYAPEGEDIALAGKKLLEEYERAPVTSKTLFFGSEKQFDGKKLSVVDDQIRICRDRSSRSLCMGLVRENKASIAENLKKNQLLISRYQTLYQYPHFYSNTSYLPETPFNAHNLVLKQIAIDWLEGRRQQALDVLTGDIRFHRMVARESQTFIHKVIAMAGLMNSYNLLQEFINECHLCVAKAKDIKTVLAGLDEDALLSRRMMEGEVRWLYATHLKTLQSVSSRYEYFNLAHGENTFGEASSHAYYGVAGYFMQYHATINDVYRRVYQPNLELSRYKYRQFEEQEKIARHQVEERMYKWYEYFYNPAGKYLNQQGMTDMVFSRYFETPFKVEAQIGLTRLQLQIKQNQIHAKTIPDFLAKQPAEKLDPYTDSPVNYNQQENTLYIQPFNRKEETVKVFL